MESPVKVNIKIIIDSVEYPMSVDSADEPLYRKAAALVNEQLIAFKSAWHIGNKGEYITFVALYFASEILREKMEENTSDVNGKLSDILNKLKMAEQLDK